MKKIRHLHDVSRLRELFEYNSVTGVLIRRSTGKPCGTLVSTGHLTVWFDGHGVGVHRVGWAIEHGEYPAVEVDHINGDGADNRLCNLRLATSAQNNQNRRLSTRNKSGIKGVFRVKWGKRKAWRVSVGHSQGQYYITHFECFGKAVKHANETRTKLHQEFARAA